MKFLCVFLLIGACAAAPSSLLRPAVDNSPLLKPAVEDNLANMHDLARPMRPNFNDLFGEVAPVAPIVEETPAEKKPLVQILVNVEDPSQVETIFAKPVTQVGTFPLIPVEEHSPIFTRPTQINTEELLKPNLVEEAPQVATFPLMPIVMPTVETKPAEQIYTGNIHTMARPKLPNLNDILGLTAEAESIVKPAAEEYSGNIHTMARPKIPTLASLLEEILSLEEELVKPAVEIPEKKPLVQIVVNVVGNAPESPIQAIPVVDTPTVGVFPLIPEETHEVPSVGTFPLIPVDEIATFPLMPIVMPGAPIVPSIPEDVPSHGTFPLLPIDEIATFPLMPIQKPEAPALTKPADFPSSHLRPAIPEDVESLLKPAEQTQPLFGTMDIHV